MRLFVSRLIRGDYGRERLLITQPLFRHESLSRAWLKSIKSIGKLCAASESWEWLFKNHNKHSYLWILVARILWGMD
jgi:hypothetical protein